MAIYVDQLRDVRQFTCENGCCYRWTHACHLTADTADELHAFAKRLGLRPTWCQRSRKGILYYDLTTCRRDAAVKLGAIEKTRRRHTAKGPKSDADES